MRRIFSLLCIITIILSFAGCPETGSGSNDTFSVTYENNGADNGSVPEDPTTYNSGDWVTVQGNTGGLERNGFGFTEWNTVSDGTGIALSEDDQIQITDNLVFWAQWGEIFSVTYAAPDAESGSVPTDDFPYTLGDEATVQDNTGSLVRSGYAFVGWCADPAGAGTPILPGDTLEMTGDVALYAKWAPEIHYNARNIETNNFDSVTAYLYYEGDYCLVYVEDGSDVTLVEARDVSVEYDANIHNQIIMNFGDPVDVDGNGKTILFLLDIQDGYSGSGGYVAGFFDPTHMYDTSTYLMSNEADMLFLDTYPANVGSAGFYGTIAHEFQHLINHSNTALDNGVKQDLWINEGLSSGAEYVYSGEVNQSRVDWFNADPVGTIAYGNNFFVWNGDWESTYANASLDNYATVSLFFQWLRIHASNGTGIYKEILASSSRNYMAVTQAASNRIDGSFGDWTALLMNWHLANILCEDSGYFGYEGELTVAMPGFLSSNNYEWDFAPGEGIASEMPLSGSNTPPASDTHIKYIGISVANGAVDNTAPYSGDIAFVFNTNSDNEGDDETGYVANRTADPLNFVMRSIEPVLPLPESWPVDVQLEPGKGVVSGGVEKNGGSIGTVSDTIRKTKAEYGYE